MEKRHILSEITRTATANGGAPLGEARFKAETGIEKREWFGVHWARWGYAIREAGLTPNKLNGAFEIELLLRKYAELAQELARLPSKGDFRLKRSKTSEFPSKDNFARLGPKTERVKKLLEYCRSRPEFGNVVAQCADFLRSSATDESEVPPRASAVRYVYLLKHGAQRVYKIGRTNNRLRREGEIGVELPEKVNPIHVINTDDPAGVEAYWHRRFAEKRMKNEWFELTADDVRAFKRWRRIY